MRMIYIIVIIAFLVCGCESRVMQHRNCIYQMQRSTPTPSTEDIIKVCGTLQDAQAERK